MNKLFDLRFVIGSFFSLTGLLLVVYSFTEKGNAPVNQYCGVGFLLFGLIMIWLSFQGKGE